MGHKSSADRPPRVCRLGLRVEERENTAQSDRRSAPPVPPAAAPRLAGPSSAVTPPALGQRCGCPRTSGQEVWLLVSVPSRLHDLSEQHLSLSKMRCWDCRSSSASRLPV